MSTTTLQDCQARSFPLPPELLLEIFGYLHDCQPALHSASLVSKQWLYCVAPILYSRPQINDTYRWATFILTLTRERMSFFYGDLIRSIDLSSGKSIVEAMKDQEFYRRLSNSTDEPTHRPVRIDNNNGRTQIRVNGSIRFQQDQQEYLLKGLPFIIVSTSSLVQISHTCKNITCLNLSYTSLLYDSLVAETGEYLSTLQRYAVQPGLTHIQIPIEQAIRSIGKECTQLQQVKIQRCEWVTAHVIWMFVYYCANLKKLDARRSTKCTVKRLIASVLEDTCSQQQQQNIQQQQQQQQQQNDDPSVTTVPSSSASSTNNDYTPFFNEQSNTEEEEEEENNVTVHFRFNEETQLYEQVEDPTQARITVVRQYTEEMENDAFWFVPFTTANDETRPIGQRPPSPMHPYLTQLNAVGNQNKSLKNIVHDILSDAKELGAIDINWLQDY
ncbi:hypothetical protein HPULCUR_004384 [Helicostylum pulchrum]|uniref:F-box domain-containing protein n=1 Tax=Helicostylum pulchrum TaxID=562976 RepID=A0ABP9XW13_9FUNG